MSRHVTYKDKQNEPTYSTDEENENAYLNGLMDLLRKSKNGRKLREPSSNPDYYELEDGYEEEVLEERERLEREKEYIHQEHAHTQKVHRELCDINNKLQEESKRLKEWEQKLERKEKRLLNAEKQIRECTLSMEDAIQKELSDQNQRLEKELETRLKEVDNENKKLRSSFKIIKKSNDALKSQVEEKDKKIEKYEKKQSSLQNRISNLQRKIEILTQQLKEQLMSQTSNERAIDRDGGKKCNQKNDMLSPSFYEVFGSVLQWLSEGYLKQHVTNLMKSLKSEHDVTTEITNEKCLKVFVSLPGILPHVGQLDDHIQINFLQFIYWSIFHSSLSHGSQKFSHSSTYRRIGEELYQVKHKEKNTAFFRSENPQSRVLSSLIILCTITQADILAQAFQALNNDLRSEQCKNYFIQYKASFILIPLFKLTNKTNVVNTLDILMIMSTESPYLHPFLENLSSVEWIQAILTVMRSCVEDTKLMEKLSLLFQRLSKLKTNKAIFEALQVKTIMCELVRSTDRSDEFLQLNLRSILFNLDSIRSSGLTKDLSV